MARDLASLADRRPLLDFDERADLGFIADFAAVQVHERRQLDVLPQLYVGGDGQIVTHRDSMFGVAV
jgi:hypothetical protein